MGSFPSPKHDSNATIQPSIAFLLIFTQFASAAYLVRDGINGQQFNNRQLKFFTDNFVPLCGNS
jgi:hypothetical protein